MKLRPMSGFAALWLLFGCSEHAIIGGLCPAGCELRSDRICDCSQVFERSDAGMPNAGGSATDPDAAAPGEPAAADGGVGSCSEPPRLDLLMVIDDGASLLPWWGAVSDGFAAFLNDDASRGMGVGLLRFGEACEPQTYLPPIVPIAPLPDNLAALEAAIPPTANITNSTIPALDAAERHAQRWKALHPSAEVAVVLITDASPGACDGLTGNYEVEAARVAQAAHSSSPSIKTYVVGIGSFELVESIARSGGTEAQRVPITANGADVLSALRTIRGQASARLAAVSTCQNRP